MKNLLLVCSLLIFGFPFLMASDVETYAINITGSTTDVKCHGGADAAIDISITGVVGDYSVSWSGPNNYSNTTEDISGLVAGTYTVTVEDDEGPLSKNFTVSEPAELKINSVETLAVSCNAGTDGSITAGNVTGGNSGYEYRLDNGTWQSSNSFSGLSAKDYILNVKDSKGCETSQQVTVTQPDALTMATPTSTPVSCNGGNDGTATAGAVSGGNSGYQYKLDTGSYGTSNTFNGLSAGTYTITVKDAKACETSQQVTVTQPDALTMATPTSTPVSCNGGNDGTATAGAVSGGNSGYQYKLDAATYGTSNSFNGLTAGTYTIWVKDAKGCETSVDVEVTQPDPLQMQAATPQQVSCHGGSDGSITAGNVTGGNSGYEYRLDNGTWQSSNSFSGLSAKDYILHVKDSKGCETSVNVEVTQPDPLEIQPAATVPVSCNGENNGSITAGTVTGGNGEYRYALNDGNFSSTKIFQNLTAGDYTLKIRDKKNCEITEVITIEEPAELQMTTNPTSTPVTCFGGNNGSITAGTVSGGTAPFQYSIDNATWNTTGIFNNVEAGTHTIFVKDANDCPLQVTVNVDEPNVLQASLNKTDVNCHDGNDGSISLTNLSGGSGDYEFSVNGTSWISSLETLEGLSAGSYEVLIRDAAATDCIIVLNGAYEINEPLEPLEVTIDASRTSAYGTSTASATANPTGGTAVYTYEWRRNGSSEILYTTQNVSGLSAGDYSLTVYDRNDCMVVEEFKIYDIVDADIVATSLCLTAEDELRTSRFEVDLSTVVGGFGTADKFEYSWHFGEDATPQTAIGPERTEVTYDAPGDKIITLTVKDEADVETELTFYQYVGACFESCGTTDNFILAEEGFFIGDENGNPISEQDCSEAADKYLWIDVEKSSNGYSLSAEIEYTINDGTQTNARRAVGCFSELLSGTPGGKGSNKPEYAIIPEGLFRLFKVEPNSTDDSMVDWKCGQEFSVEQINIRWTNNSDRGCGENPQNMCVGLSNEVDVSTPIIASVEKEDVLCFAGETGSIFINASGGVRPYEYSINGNIAAEYTTNNRFFDLPAGTYSEIYVKDSKGTTVNLPPLVIEQPTKGLTGDIVEINAPCFGEFGSAKIINLEGGTPFIDENGNEYFEYLWNDPRNQITQEADSLSAGNYTVTVIDANGCQIIEEVTITEPEQLSVAETGENQVYECGFNTTTLEANNPVTGIGYWTIVEENSAAGGQITDPTIPNSEFKGGAGTYTLRWTIAHQDGSCSTYSEMEVTFSEACNTLDFDGVDDHIVIGDHLGFTTNNFSIEAWVKPKSVNNARSIFSKRNSNNLSSGFDLIINSGAPTFRWGNKAVSTSQRVDTDRWYHIAAIYNNGNISLYVDGIRVGNATATNPVAVNAPALIGAMHDADNPDVPVNYFHGWIEEVRLWKKALSVDQLRFLMNQRLEVGTSPVKGTTLPMAVPGTLNYTDLAAYYPLIATEAADGITKDQSPNGLDGHLRNIVTDQDNTAPLPYVAAKAGDWWDTNTWQEPLVWDPPSSPGITGDTIAWNIVRLNNKLVHNPASTNNSKSIDLLALLDEGGTLDMQGANNVSGNGLLITRYLKLDGILDLNGESQLIQSEGSEVVGSGHIERDQQGTASSFNYNYWSSPVLPLNKPTYTVSDVMFDGTTSGTGTHKIINFGDRYAHADGALSSPIKISNYWINAFRKREANQYSQWERIGSDPTDTQYFLKPGEGYTMKGTYWVSVKQNKLQNYTFKGFPNNGDIELSGITANQNYLIGNPYPSAVNAIKFIEGHLKNSNPSLSGNVFNGTIYYWDHYSGQTHYLEEYIGGYSAYNLAGGVPAIANDERINFETNETTTKRPGPYIPVGQGFFINTASGASDAETNANITGGTIKFRNDYRVFASEANEAQSLFLSHESPSKQKAASAQANKMQKDTRYKIRLQFNSPKGYLREILVAADRNSTNSVDLGYDAPLLDNSEEDMYWMINENEFVMQGVPHFYLDQVLPIGLKIAEESEFGIKISELENLPDHMNIYLLDKTEDTYHDLRESDFKTTLSPETYNDKYEIVFYNGEEPEDETTENDDQELAMGYSYNSRELHIKNPEMLEINKLVIYSISGQEVHDFDEVETAKLITLELDKPLSSAVYVVRAYTNKGVIATQVIIKQ
ncbi:MAG TPA: LamG-like jellyroll fold domain-containing protein [Salegentibacter sp.]|nr:LamG-like jellyroll fold domain-containing protein [Salegentibacter sp.]